VAVRVRLFAGLRERAGWSERELDGAATVGDVWPALGLGDATGTLTPGKAADVCVLDLSGSSFLPWDDPITAAVYGGSCDRVSLTMVDGEIRYRRGSRESPTASAARAKMIQA